jgi:hypothetical protein
MGNENSCNRFVATIDETPVHIQKQIYDMYYRSYSDAGEKLWFGNQAELVKGYPCGVAYVCSKSGNTEDVQCAVLFQKRKIAKTQDHYTVKLSLIIHAGTVDSKAQLFNLLGDLLKQPGVYIEASGAVSWLLRKNNVPMIASEKQIHELLQLPQDQQIVINPVYRANDKASQYYVHIYSLAAQLTQYLL